MSNKLANIAFLGLGRMGTPMAHNLLKAGYAVKGYDISQERLTQLVSNGGEASTSPEDAARGADLIISMIMNDAILEAVTYGEGGSFHGAATGTLFTDLSTVSPMASERVAAAAKELGIRYLRAKVAGSITPAESGTLTIFASGAKEDYDACLDVLKVMGSNIYHVGDAEVAHYLKLVHSIIVGVYAGMLGEALAFGERGGADWEQMIDILKDGPLGSILLDIKTPVFKARDYLSPPSDINTAAKDLDLALETAHKMHIPLPMTALVRQLMSAMQANGRGDVDIFAVVDEFETMAGLPTSIKR